MSEPAYLIWRKASAPAIRAQAPGTGSFVTVDPGGCGAALLYVGACERPILIGDLNGRGGAMDFAERVAERRTEDRESPRVLVIEEPFVGKNVQSGLVTAATSNHFVGAFSALVRPEVVVFVPAQSWQALAVPRSLGKRDERKAAMVERARRAFGDDPRFANSSKERRSAIADAHGMALWWKAVRHGS